MQSHMRTLSFHHNDLDWQWSITYLKDWSKNEAIMSQVLWNVRNCCFPLFLCPCYCLPVIVMKQKSCSWLFCQFSLHLKKYITQKILESYFSVYFGINYSDVITQYPTNQLQHPILTCMCQTIKRQKWPYVSLFIPPQRPPFKLGNWDIPCMQVSGEW